MEILEAKITQLTDQLSVPQTTPVSTARKSTYVGSIADSRRRVTMSTKDITEELAQFSQADETGGSLLVDFTASTKVADSVRKRFTNVTKNLFDSNNCSMTTKIYSGVIQPNGFDDAFNEFFRAVADCSSNAVHIVNGVPTFQRSILNPENSPLHNAFRSELITRVSADVINYLSLENTESDISVLTTLLWSNFSSTSIYSGISGIQACQQLSWVAEKDTAISWFKRVKIFLKIARSTCTDNFFTKEMYMSLPDKFIEIKEAYLKVRNITGDLTASQIALMDPDTLIDNVRVNNAINPQLPYNFEPLVWESLKNEVKSTYKIDRGYAKKHDKVKSSKSYLNVSKTDKDKSNFSSNELECKNCILIKKRKDRSKIKTNHSSQNCTRCLKCGNLKVKDGRPSKDGTCKC
jgi:hypothetical protein